MLLEIRQLQTGYGKKPVLFDISIELEKGEIVAIIGPNGAGKSTVLKAACGLLPVWGGDIMFDGERTNGLSAVKNVGRGMTFCPQGNRVFDQLTVRENLEIGGFRLARREVRPRLDEVLGLFPGLRGRLKQNAGTLSGGEQQMLAVARALMPRPRLLLLDEPSLGLAPSLLDNVFKKIAEIRQQQGVAILIVEQKVRKVLDLSDRVYALKLGNVVHSGPATALGADPVKLKQIFL